MNRIQFYLDKTCERTKLWIDSFVDIFYTAATHIDHSIDTAISEMQYSYQAISKDIDRSFVDIKMILSLGASHVDNNSSNITSLYTMPVVLNNGIDMHADVVEAMYSLYRYINHVDYDASTVSVSYTKPITLSEYTFTIGDSTKTLSGWCYETIG